MDNGAKRELSPIYTSGEVKGLPAACIFIPFLAPETSEERLHQHCERLYGPVLKASIRKEEKTMKPFAFVQFLNVEDATKAIADSERQSLDGVPIKIDRAKVNTSLFCAKIPKSLTNAVFREMCERFGIVERVAIMLDPTTYESKGCAFVKYMYKEDAREALKHLQNENPRWMIDWSKSTKEFDKWDLDRLTLYVGGIARGITEEMVREKFAKYGNLEYVTYVKPQPDELKDGYAFVRYSDKISAAKALENEGNSEWFGRHIRVDYPDPPSVKEEKKKKREASGYHPQAAYAAASTANAWPPAAPAPAPIPYTPIPVPYGDCSSQTNSNSNLHISNNLNNPNDIVGWLGRHTCKSKAANNCD